MARQANPWNEERRLVMESLAQLRNAQDALAEKMETNQVKIELKLDQMSNGHDRKLQEIDAESRALQREISSLTSKFGERIRAVEVRSGIYAALALALALLAKFFLK